MLSVDCAACSGVDCAEQESTIGFCSFELLCILTSVRRTVVEDCAVVDVCGVSLGVTQGVNYGSGSWGWRPA